MTYEEIAHAMRKNKTCAFYDSDGYEDEINLLFENDMGMIADAMEKHIPKKTITIENNLIRNGCPACNCVNEDGNNYCRYCGQRLDWEGWRL